MGSRSSEVVIIAGAGVSGLACAQSLIAAGRPVIVLERARAVGGRCATRRLGDQLVDFGPIFLHGRDPQFVSALGTVSATRASNWPTVVEGQGQPCQPDAFDAGEQRLAFAEGVTVFPQALAQGVSVRFDQNVERLEVAGSNVLLETSAGQEHQAPTVVLALAAEQSRTLLLTMTSPSPAVRGAVALLGFSRSHACLTVMALYPAGAPVPPWQVLYPRDSNVLQLVSHESTKRASAGRVAMVLQARPAWSRTHLNDETWAQAMLAEAGRVVGAWMSAPEVFKAHPWSFARSDRSAELAAPMLLSLPGGARLGVCGDRFAPGGGVEAAWRSGRALAARIISEPQEQP